MGSPSLSVMVKIKESVSSGCFFLYFFVKKSVSYRLTVMSSPSPLTALMAEDLNLAYLLTGV